MKKKNARNTKGKIVSAAWQLFYQQGYDDTTVEEIVEASGTSRGSFYHYFDGKDALLSSLSYLFDEKYDELAETMDASLTPVEKLIFMNQELFLMIDNTVSVDLLSQLFATQLITSGEKHMMSPSRTYYKLLRQVVSEGKQLDFFKEEFSVNDITKAYAMFERGLMYDWCISGGSYSLCQYSQSVLPLFLGSFCAEQKEPKLLFLFFCNFYFAITSAPPIYFLSTSGILTLPSAC